MSGMNEKKGILTETGTNEFEIIEFSIGKVNYGINVAKVREVINRVPTTQLPNAHSYVDGIFTLRGRIMPLVNLPRCLGAVVDPDDESAGQNIIVSELNNYFVGFLVDKVSRIHRVSWEHMEPPPDITESEMVVGIIKMNEKMVVLLDFEKIVSEINPEINRKLSAVPEVSVTKKEGRNKKTLLIAEDSHMLRDLLVNTLKTAGYVNILSYPNGREAWEKLEALAKTGQPVEKNVNLVITDIEMPQMDGHNLTKRIKADRDLQILPVVIFSSLINEEMRRKGEALGASAQISKPEIAMLIDLVYEHAL